MRIEDKLLTQGEIGSKVTYIPRHAKDDASHPDAEGGTISSWNDKFVFVNYGRTGTSQATPPELLRFG